MALFKGVFFRIKPFSELAFEERYSVKMELSELKVSVLHVQLDVSLSCY